MTTPMNKTKFLAWVEKEISEEACIILSNDLDGNLEVKKKALKLPMVVSQAAFKSPGVGHIAFGKSHLFSIIITEREQVSEAALTIIDK